MPQNRSAAVMQQRVEPPDSLDFFPTPAWGTRALCEYLDLDVGITTGALTAWEPACGEGHMVRPLKEYFAEVYASDCHDYGDNEIYDFLLPSKSTADWIITNPPFRLADQFAECGLRRANYGGGVALLVRTAFLEGQRRYENLFRREPPAIILQFSERLPMFKGRVDRAGTTATAYCWIIWTKPSAGGTRFDWIGPSRRRLERDEDYV